MKIHRFVTTLGILLSGTTAANATNLGFGFGNNNDTIPANFGSYASADDTGYVVSLGGATPNIGLTWDSDWDIHHSSFFAPLENTFVGGTPWDSNGTEPSIAQLDATNNFHTIAFAPDPGFALVLTSFDFAHTAETEGTTKWTLTLTDSMTETVWSEEITFVNGEVVTVTPEFTGAFGEIYTLRFDRTESSYGSNGRHGLDNLQFSQVAIPEPGTVALLGAAGFGLILLSRRRK